MVKKSCVSNSISKNNRVLKLNSNSGVQKNVVRCTGGTGFKRARQRTKANGISGLMSKCALKPKKQTLVCESERKSTFQKILNNMQENEKKRKSNAKSKQLRDLLKLLNKLHH